MSKANEPRWWSPLRWWPGARNASRQEEFEQRVTADVIELVRENRFDPALEVLHGALAQSSDSKVLHELLGALHFKRGAGAEAISALNQAQALGPPDPRIHNLLGLCHMLSGDEQAGLRSFERAIAIDPAYAPALANAGWLAFAMGGAQPYSGHFRKWLLQLLPAGDQPLPAVEPRLQLPSVTLVCVDCAYHQLAIHALRRSMAQCAFGAVRFFTDQAFDLEGIEVVQIERIASAADYSNFLIHRLGEFVATDFVLVVQYDGFVLHPQAWSARFLEYDYLGACIPAPAGPIVGNGGFSLRSKKLLNALADPLIVAYVARSDPWQEDMAICIAYREHLEAAWGMRIAPADVAAQFSVEFTRPHAGAFGFHGLVNLAHAAERNFRQLEPAGTTRIGISLSASTALGEFHIANSVETLGNPQFGNDAYKH